MTTTQQSPAASSAAGEPAALAIAAHGLTQRFGDVAAVDSLDLEVHPGEVVAFLGPNGAGKTSTIDMFLGLSAPTAGDVQIFGHSPRAAVSRGLVAAVMQTGGLLKDITVAETVELTASVFAASRPPAEALERAGLTDLASRKVGVCSGGEQQRLRFAMALVSDPALIILDEPTTGMDVNARHEFWSAISDDARRGRTVLFATHYLEEADRYADRIVLVRQGRVVADGTAAQIKAMASGRTVRATFSAPDTDALAALPGVDLVEQHGNSVLLHVADSDSIARHLLTRTDARDVEIAARGLEDAFLALTTENTSRPENEGDRS
ncbi:ABC transporter ATP-binding protein [Dermacoccaceae bacterium W4C1]